MTHKPSMSLDRPLEDPQVGNNPTHEIDLQIADLIKDNNLVEMHDILPTAFLLTASSASDMRRFKKRFSDIHIGKGLSLNENLPEKHCLNNQWILKPAAAN